VRPDGKKDPAFENLRRIADETADTLAANCPKDVEAVPSGRLDALGRSLDAVEAALDALQRPLQTLYDSARNEQRAGPGTRSGFGSDDTGRETSRVRARSRNRASADREPLRRAPREPPPEPPPEPPHETAAAAPEWNCEQWGAELRAWPVARVEEIVQPGPRQRAAFYELAASFQHAADLLADACPSQSDATSLMTPLGQMSQIRKKLDAVRESVMMIRPALERFDAMLDTAQRKRFRDSI
jgi:hypothetical protein